MVNKQNNSPFSPESSSGLHSQLILLFAVWCCFSCNHTAQNPNGVETVSVFQADSLFVPTGHAKLDSLLQLAAVAPQDTVLVRLYDKIGDLFAGFDHQKAKEYYFKNKKMV